MPERKPSPEAELFDEVKDVALEAATQLLNGIALAKDASDRISERLRSKLDGIDGRVSQGPLGDLLFNGVRVSTSQVKAALTFQRWATETLTQTILGGGNGNAVAPKKPNKPVEAFAARLGGHVTCGAERADGVERIGAHNTYVQVWCEGSGPRFYVDWDEMAPPEKPSERDLVWLRLDITKARFRVGCYAGRIVVRGDGADRVTAIRLEVSAD